MDDIQRELGLDRDGLIHMALLLGSDYTEGVAGIGVVNALEVCSASLAGLACACFACGPLFKRCTTHTPLCCAWCAGGAGLPLGQGAAAVPGVGHEPG